MGRAIYLVPLFFDLLQLQQHRVHTMLVEIAVLLQRPVFQLQIFHLLEVLATSERRALALLEATAVVSQPLPSPLFQALLGVQGQGR